MALLQEQFGEKVIIRKSGDLTSCDSCGLCRVESVQSQLLLAEMYENLMIH